MSSERYRERHCERYCDAEWARSLPASSREENDRIYLLILAGNADARDLMIRSNVPLVISLVETYIKRGRRKYRYLRSDMFSAGLVGLIQAVDKMVRDGQVDTPNPTGLISTFVRGAIGEVLVKESCIRVPRGADAPVVLHGVDPDSISYDPDHLRNLREQLFACCDTEAEQDVIKLRLEGYSDLAIGKMLSLSEWCVTTTRRHIYNRFLVAVGWWC